ncbi:hypothetical protein GCM10023215_44480 [Pseudonocardia yuanmonensis]|uniref:Uncharacterized protein n=1 Tax=Pseudonocardia yuanmonensis TaxID=1095914 RepID=A0ABP8X6M8_9PSEU
MTVTLTASRTAPRVAGEGRPRSELPASPAHPKRRVDAATTVPDIVDIWGHDSFPASDAPANW